MFSEARSVPRAGQAARANRCTLNFFLASSSDSSLQAIAIVLVGGVELAVTRERRDLPRYRSAQTERSPINPPRECDTR